MRASHLFPPLAVIIILAGCMAQQPDVREPIASDLQGWADFDHSGFLEEPEVVELTHAILRAVIEPHDVENPIDEFLDGNRNGHVDPPEVDFGRHIFLVVQFERFYEFVPEDELAPPVVDTNQDRRIGPDEIRWVHEFIFGNPALRNPRPVEGPREELMDKNRDGKVDGQEIEDATFEIIRSISLLPVDMPEDVYRSPQEDERRKVRNDLDALADLNEDGFVDPFENELMEVGLGEPHEVQSLFDERIDFNRNEVVEPFEIVRARRAGEFTEREPMDGRPDAYPVVTLIDEQLDLNRDGSIQEMEINRIVEILVRGLEGVERDNPIYQLVDADGNGEIVPDEVFLFRERYLMPHPSNEDFPLDGELDKNRDGFIDPEEIGVAAGYSPAGEVPPFEERMERIRWEMEREMTEARERETGKAAVEMAAEEEKKTTEDEKKPTEEAAASGDSKQVAAAVVKEAGSDFYNKLGEIQDKKIAIVSLRRVTTNVDEETADGVMVFIENAFVNIGKVKVVDRQNIAKIIKEYEFQSSELTDETTAVKIGQLLGADIIVIGSISYVGKKFYLNVKLIEVETAEILGSSIADAKDETEFLSMCNNAVYKLF